MGKQQKRLSEMLLAALLESSCDAVEKAEVLMALSAAGAIRAGMTCQEFRDKAHETFHAAEDVAPYHDDDEPPPPLSRMH